jgi:hypothetical protein
VTSFYLLLWWPDAEAAKVYDEACRLAETALTENREFVFAIADELRVKGKFPEPSMAAR